MHCLSLTFPSWLNPIGQCCSLSRHHTSDNTAQISPGLSVSRGDTTTRPQAKTIKSNQQIGRSFGAADNPSDSQLDGKFPLPRSVRVLPETIYLCMCGVHLWQPEPRTRQTRACGRQSTPLSRFTWTADGFPAVVMPHAINSFSFRDKWLS